jgi:hypothetical protein
LAAAIASGADEQRIPPIDSLVVDEVMRHHRQDAKLKASALLKLEADHKKARADLDAAERAVVAAVDTIFEREDRDAAAHLAHLLDEAHRIGRELLLRAIAEECAGNPPLEEVTTALQRLDFPILDRMEIGLNLAKYGDTEAAAARADRRAALISGETPPPEEKAA